MSRRHRAPKRIITPDVKYQSSTLTKFIKKVMLHGKRQKAEAIVYNAIEILAKRTKKPEPLQAFEEALSSAQPKIEVKSRRVGGATYQVPVETTNERSEALAMRWIINFARKKKGLPMTEALAKEFEDISNNVGQTMKKREDTHRMAEANKAFAHFRW